MKTHLSVLFLTVCLSLFVSIRGLSQTGSIIESNRSTLALDKDRPDLTIDLGRVAKLKILTQKKVFSSGDTLILDVAVLTAKDAHYYFPESFEPEITILNHGKNIPLKSLIIIDRDPKYAISEDSLIRKSLILTVGCDAYNELKRKMEKVDVESNAAVFEQNLYGTIGDACMDISAPMDLEISAKVSNDRVVVAASKTKEKTAVGSLVSNTLTITIK